MRLSGITFKLSDANHNFLTNLSVYHRLWGPVPEVTISMTVIKNTEMMEYLMETPALVPPGGTFGGPRWLSAILTELLLISQSIFFIP